MKNLVKQISGMGDWQVLQGCRQINMKSSESREKL